MATLNGTASPNGQALNYVTGDALRRLLWGKTAGERNRIAAQLIKDKVAIVDPSPAQIARLCEANPGGVSVGLGHAGRRGPHRRTIDRVIKRFGAEPLMRGLDRLTAPQRSAAE